jgi:MFS family permease
MAISPGDERTDGDGTASRGGARLPFPAAVAAGALMLAATAPGQTSVVAVFVDPMLTDLGMSRTAVSTAYTVGTVAAAAGLVAIGVLVDRWGVRAVLTVTAVAFAAAIAGMAAVAGPISLAAGFAGIRLLGAGALNLLATTAVTIYAKRRRGTAIGLAAAIGSAAISVIPLGMQWLVDVVGWRLAWLLTALTVGMLLLPLAGLLPGRAVTAAPAEPTSNGEDHAATPGGTASVELIRRPLRSAFYWTLVAAVAVNSLIGTGLIFHQISLLTEQGLSATAAAATFLPQTLAGLLAAAAAGWLADHIRPHHLLLPNMTLTAVALLLAPRAAPGWSVLVYAVALGASIGAIRAVEGACLAYYFDPAQLGRLRGLTLTAIVLAAAPGPLPMAWAHAATGSYTTATTVLLVLPAIVAAAALITAPPADGRLRGSRVRHRPSTFTQAASRLKPRGRRR